VIEKLTEVPSGITAFRAEGKISRDEYDAAVLPLIKDAVRHSRQMRCLCEVGPDLSMTPGAAWEDVKVGLRALRLVEACAVVSDTGWVRDASRLAGFFMPCPVRVFSARERDQAIAWLTGLPEGASGDPPARP
jgi:hypothetical protein